MVGCTVGVNCLVIMRPTIMKAIVMKVATRNMINVLTYNRVCKIFKKNL